MVQTLVGHRDMAITSLAWLQEPTTRLWRLFSGGLDGSLTEWDLLARRPKHRTDALGGAVWAMATRPTEEGTFFCFKDLVRHLLRDTERKGKVVCYDP